MSETIESDEGKFVWPITDDSVFTYADALETLLDISFACESGIDITNYEADGNTLTAEPRLSLHSDLNGEIVGTKLIDALNNSVIDGAVFEPPDPSETVFWTIEKAATSAKCCRLLISLQDTYKLWLETDFQMTPSELEASNKKWEGR